MIEWSNLKIFKSLEYSGLLSEVSETIKNEAKERKGGFLIMLLGTLASTLIRDLLAGKGIVRAEYGSKVKRTIRVDYRPKGSSFLKRN